MNKDDLTKLEATQVSVQEKILQRERRYLIQYAIQLFNNIDKVDKKIATKILFLINFLGDEVECKYKIPEFYANFGVNQDLKEIWLSHKEMLGRLRANYQ
jgi:hypothetical protein